MSPTVLVSCDAIKYSRVPLCARFLHHFCQRAFQAQHSASATRASLLTCIPEMHPCSLPLPSSTNSWSSTLLTLYLHFGAMQGVSV